MKKKFVISAVNFVEGGPLTVLRECAAAAAELKDWQVLVLTHDHRLLDGIAVQALEFPKAKSSWLQRLFHEWKVFHDLSLEWKPAVWLSLHDITPRVNATAQFVYCHNPAPFYAPSFREAFLEPKLLLFSLFYGMLYRLNQGANEAVIVQQEWLRSEFKRRFKTPKVIVAHPVADENDQVLRRTGGAINNFIYPALPRVFKNFEVLCEAARILAEHPEWAGAIKLTISGTENRYARWLYRKYRNVPGLEFIGQQNRKEMLNLYQASQCLLFPSKLETWGLPITEAKSFSLPMIIADLPYARETVGTYSDAQFAPPNAPADWAKLILHKHINPSHSKPSFRPLPDPPFSQSWSGLIEALTDRRAGYNPG